MADTPTPDPSRQRGPMVAVDWAISGLNAVGTLWIFAIMVAINADVFARFLFSAPISGVPLLIELSIVAIVFAQLAAALRGGRMTRSDILIGRLLGSRPMLGHTLQAIYHLAGAVLMAGIVVYVLPILERVWARGTYAGMEGDVTFAVWPFKLFVVLGAGFCAIQFLRELWADLRFIGRQRRAGESLRGPLAGIAAAAAVALIFLALGGVLDLSRAQIALVSVLVTLRVPGDDGTLVISAPSVLGDDYPLIGMLTPT